jgi:hypothetical protein
VILMTMTSWIPLASILLTGALAAQQAAVGDLTKVPLPENVWPGQVVGPHPLTPEQQWTLQMAALILCVVANCVPGSSADPVESSRRATLKEMYEAASVAFSAGGSAEGKVSVADLPDGVAALTIPDARNGDGSLEMTSDPRSPASNHVVLGSDFFGNDGSFFVGGPLGQGGSAVSLAGVLVHEQGHRTQSLHLDGSYLSDLQADYEHHTIYRAEEQFFKDAADCLQPLSLAEQRAVALGEANAKQHAGEIARDLEANGINPPYGW